MNNICLIGFMGSGKTTIGEVVAQQLNMPWIDLDTYIVQESGKSISRIFNEVGETSFRQLETQSLKIVLQKEGHVISTGGGIVTSEENIAALQEGVTIYLAYPFESLYERIKGDKNRPLATSYEALKERFESRLALYEKAAQVKIDCKEKSINHIAEEIINTLERISE